MSALFVDPDARHTHDRRRRYGGGGLKAHRRTEIAEPPATRALVQCRVKRPHIPSSQQIGRWPGAAIGGVGNANLKTEGAEISSCQTGSGSDKLRRLRADV